ncbi:MAG: hypothetical protein EAY79_05175 [Runella slithyformis]|nr:MAG: hypothetical protein EAY79_05175 [Runella slithyformis]
MAINKEIKQEITKEWLSSIPQLSAFAQNKFYRIVGCCIIGVELIKLPHSGEYRPHFVMYPLWEIDLKKCLDTPSIYFTIKNNKGLQLDIPYLNHNIYFSEAIKCLKNQTSILLNNNITLKSLFDLVDNRFNSFLVKSNSAQQAKLFELKFYIALYIGSQSQMQLVLSQIQQASKNWNMQMFEIWYGKFDLWLQRLNDKIGNREEFLDQIEANKQDKKIAQLKISEITL